MPIAFLLFIFPFCMIFSALSDFMSMQISNRISIILFLSFAILAPFTNIDLYVYMEHFLFAFGVLLIGFVLFSFGFCGGGDAKLLASISLWIGCNFLFLEYLYITSILGLILGIAIISYQKSFLPDWIGDNIFLRKLNTTKHIPYGCALGFGGLLVYPESYLGAWAINWFAS